MCVGERERDVVFHSLIINKHRRIASAECAPRKYGQNCTRTCGFCNNNEVCDHVTGNCTRCVDNREMPLCQGQCALGSHIYSYMWRR